jgi:hypothetical protein
MGLSIPNEVLQKFINKGIEVSGAIKKIDFTNLNSQIGDLLTLLDDVKNGTRTISKENYQKIINNNQGLTDSFM